MTISIWLAVIGIILTATFGVFGIWGFVIFIKAKHSFKVVLVRESIIALFDQIVKELPELAISYKEDPIASNLVLVKAALVNVGKKDIHPSMIEEPISISLPKGSKWKEVKFVSKSDGVAGNFIIKDEYKLIVTSGLFRSNEFVRFQALAEVQPTDDKKDLEKIVKQSIQIHHRISNLRKINQVDYSQPNRKKLVASIITTSLFLFLLLGLTAFIVFWGPTQKFLFGFEVNEKVVPVTVTTLRRDILRIKEHEGSFKQTIKTQEFLNQQQGIIGAIQQQNWAVWVYLGFILVQTLTSWATFIPDYRKYRKNLRIAKTLRIDKQE